MAKVAFGKTPSQGTEPVSAPEAPSPTTTAVATIQKASPPSIFGGDDSIDFRDVVLPRINLVQKVGELSNNFPPGSLVADLSLVLPQPIEAYFLGFRPTRFVERVQGGGMGNICNTEAEVVEAGGTLDFNTAAKTEKPWYQFEATAILIVKKPSEVTDDALFPYEFDGAKFGIFAWSMKGSAYTAGVKPLKTAKKISYLRRGYHTFAHKVSGSLEKFRTGNSAYVPKIEKGAETSPQFAEFIQAILSGEIA